ncbi:hypothetical protein A2U01_0118367, partial [Trifolium medium]|nr:hypothetical protein [Trifolium medium]
FVGLCMSARLLELTRVKSTSIALYPWIIR